MPRPARGNSTNAFLETKDGIFDDWEEYTVSSDLLTPSDSFSFTKPVPPAVNGKRDTTKHKVCKKGDRCYLRVASERGTTLQLRGRVWHVETSSEKGAGSEYHVAGFDHMKPLVNADVMPGINYSGTFAELIYQVVAPFGYGRDDIIIDPVAQRGFLTGRNMVDKEVPAPATVVPPRIGETLSGAISSVGASVSGALSTLGAPGASIVSGGTDLSASAISAALGAIEGDIDVSDPPPRFITIKALDTIPIDKARAHPGETVHAFLHRHATRFGLLIWSTVDGKIVFGRPDYAQKPSYSFRCFEGARGRQNNVKSIKRVETIEHRPSEINVYGHSYGGDTFTSPIHAVVYDQDVQALGIYQPISIHDNAAKTNRDADQRAQHELSLRRQTSDVISILVKGHASDDGTIFAIDTMADVQWDAGDVHGPMYVIGRTFTRSKHAGEMTRIQLVPPYSIVLGDPSA